jgi:hypothetical protein
MVVLCTLPDGETTHDRLRLHPRVTRHGNLALRDVPQQPAQGS